MIKKEKLHHPYTYDTNERYDTEALIESWISQYGHDIKWLAYSYVKDHSTAEDITQETFIKAHMKYDSFMGQSSIKTWLYKIAINACKDHLKSSYIRRVVSKANPFNYIPSSDDTPEKEVIHKSEDHQLMEQVLRLEDKYREVIVLYYYEEFDINELAHMMKVSPNTVKTRLRRARQILQHQLTSEGSFLNE
ncbi:sigma-70 family RNA polymerase sigma factor [Thalassobacillus hwangdonensis]|uniref:Sigma-70 family RNA polymerase sigma factor n=1 Tax=Thalassobacillus hwangdonensis TaxID=546108 RepID=A0ABW3L0A1_9BACI